MARALEGGGVAGNEGTRADCQNVAGAFFPPPLPILDTASRELLVTVFFLRAFNCSQRLPLIPATLCTILY